jgi:phage terminase large subunit-like protein
VLEVIRGWFPFEKLKRTVIEVKRRYGSSPTLLIQDAPISRGLIQSLKEQSINVKPYKPETDKRSRLIAQTDLFAGGSVRLPRRATGPCGATAGRPLACGQPFFQLAFAYTRACSSFKLSLRYCA